MVDTENKPMPVIEIENVCLRIPISTQGSRSLKNALIRSVTGGTIRKTRKGTVVEALKNISCTINKGDRVALIGHNGAGKSSFLRLVSEIYRPSSGRFISRTRVHPMLQKCFITSPELSGLDAVKGHYLLEKGNLEGFRDYLEEIVEFSELGDFIKLPLKGYSEGMNARLLFALLTSGRHECLALDEGFGTGDRRFFGKAQKRLNEFMGSTGTLFLASHSEALLREFCNRGMVFKNGEIEYDGEIGLALDYYHEGSN